MERGQSCPPILADSVASIRVEYEHMRAQGVNHGFSCIFRSGWDARFFYAKGSRKISKNVFQLCDFRMVFQIPVSACCFRNRFQIMISDSENRTSFSGTGHTHGRF